MTPSAPLEFELLVPPGPRAPAVARHTLGAVGEPLVGELAERASLLLSELVTNSVRHARLGSWDRIAVRARMAAGLRVEVLDPGNGFRWNEGSEPSSESGFGLEFLQALSDRWGVRTGPPTCVWFEIDPKCRTADRSSTFRPLGDGVIAQPSRRPGLGASPIRRVTDGREDR
jgi:anti-sigma regulatory factor (Ser/Thr protein kinase)